jgi:hypothetical protein
MSTVTYEQVVNRVRTLTATQLAAVSAFLDEIESDSAMGGQRVFLCATEEEIVTETEMVRALRNSRNSRNSRNVTRATGEAGTTAHDR